MSAKPRCKECRHPRKRIVTPTVKRGHNNTGHVEPRIHKKSCDCSCHN